MKFDEISQYLDRPPPLIDVFYYDIDFEVLGRPNLREDLRSSVLVAIKAMPLISLRFKRGVGDYASQARL